MFLPTGYHTFRACALIISVDDADFDRSAERLGSALAGGELAAFGVVIWTVDVNDEVREVGELRPIRPEIWRGPGAREAVLGKGATDRLHQDGFILFPVIQATALLAWNQADRDNHQIPQPAPSCMTEGPRGLFSGVHPVPAGYVTFDCIPRVARAWQKLEPLTLN